MTWIAPFVQNRKTFSNFSNVSEDEREEEEVEEDEREDEREEEILMHEEDGRNSFEHYDAQNIQPESPSICTPQNSNVTGRQKHSGRRKTKAKSSEKTARLEEKEEIIMDTIQKRFLEPKTEDILYGELLAKKLAKLPIELNMQAKHDIDNYMFRLSMTVLKQNQPPPVYNAFPNMIVPDFTGYQANPSSSCSTPTSNTNFHNKFSNCTASTFFTQHHTHFNTRFSTRFGTELT